jgi:carboxypeptidase Taq
VHEGGHGIYEQNVSERLRGTPLSTGASNALHESQSRFYENNLFRNQAFVRYFYPKLKSVYPEQLAAVDAEALYRAINIVEPSLIRTEADELTYSLHILLRYELELALISGTLSVADLPKAWYDKMEQYLGVVPANDSEGVLQDVHWSEALFGYFPTYALGSAYAAQLYAYMSRDLALEDLLAAGNFEPITRWLNEKVHQFGALYEPTALIEKITGEPLNANYYCDYLEKKYTALYQL